MSSCSDEPLEGALTGSRLSWRLPLTFLDLGHFQASVGYVLGLGTEHPPDMSSGSDKPLEGALSEVVCSGGDVTKLVSNGNDNDG